ncbi:MAG: pH regulation protein F [Gammaproteobacteria bacterium]|nr:pH regulation protein F [Gammaproteobacteria bacterium]
MIEINYLIIVMTFLIIISLIRFLTSKDIYTKILTVNVVSTKIILLICLVSSLLIDRDYIDIALVYALINFIVMIIVSKYLINGKIQ